MNTATHNVVALSPEAFASLPKKRSLFPCAPGYSRNRVFHPWKETDKPLGEYALSCETLRWPHSLFPGKHGSVFTRGPSPLNPYTIQLTRCSVSILPEVPKRGNCAPAGTGFSSPCVNAGAFKPFKVNLNIAFRSFDHSISWNSHFSEWQSRNNDGHLD